FPYPTLFRSSKEIVLIDFSLFKNKPYSGATFSNFLLNAIAGTLVVANTYVQVDRGFSSFQSGMLSLGYLVAVLAMIRVGEKILQRASAKSPMIWGALITDRKASCRERGKVSGVVGAL